MMDLAYLLSLTQKELKLKLYDYLKNQNMNPIFENGFVYAKGEIPILLVAHMDTVFKNPPKEIYYNEQSDMIFSPSGGIGGDDRCGIYAITQLLEKYRPHVLFTEDEEIGCVGAKKAVKKLQKPDVKYIIEFDRKGSNDCVFYDCGNEDFINHVESFGFITDYGTCSDISILGSEWDIASVNLSSGYYNEHTPKEYIIFGELKRNINRVASMLKAHNKTPYFDYQEKRYGSDFYDVNFEGFSDEDIIWMLEQSYRYRKMQFHQEQEDDKSMSLRRSNNSNNKRGLNNYDE